MPLNPIPFWQLGYSTSHQKRILHPLLKTIIYPAGPVSNFTLQGKLSLSKQGKSVTCGGWWLTPSRKADGERLAFFSRTTSASTAPCAFRRICCLTHGANYCAVCQPLLRGFCGWVRSPPPTGQMDTVMREGLGEQLVHAIHTLNNTKIVVHPSFLRYKATWEKKFRSPWRNAGLLKLSR